MGLDPASKRSYDERFSTVRQITASMLIPEQDQYKLTVKDLKRGGVFRFQGKTYVVLRIGWYNEADDQFNKKKFITYELNCLCLENGEKRDIEWEEDDGLQVSITSQRLSFRELTDDAGEAIDEDDLDQIVDDDDCIVFQGEKYWVDDDWAALYYRTEDDDEPEKVYMYEFMNESKTKGVTIEEWDSGSGKEEYQIYGSRPVNPDDFIILATKGRDSI
jgi:hypothetical protein